MIQSFLTPVQDMGFFRILNRVLYPRSLSSDRSLEVGRVSSAPMRVSTSVSNDFGSASDIYEYTRIAILASTAGECGQQSLSKRISDNKSSHRSRYVVINAFDRAENSFEMVRNWSHKDASFIPRRNPSQWFYPNPFCRAHE
jgi:hypothetical protein